MNDVILMCDVTCRVSIDSSDRSKNIKYHPFQHQKMISQCLEFTQMICYNLFQEHSHFAAENDLTDHFLM